MRGEGRGRREQQHMVVMRADDRRDRDEGVAARLILDHHRLTPLGRQLVGEHARRDVDAGAGAERNDEADRPRRPAFWRRRRSDARYQRGETAKDQVRTDERRERRMGVSSIIFL